MAKKESGGVDVTRVIASVAKQSPAILAIIRGLLRSVLPCNDE